MTAQKIIHETLHIGLQRRVIAQIARGGQHDGKPRTVFARGGHHLCQPGLAAGIGQIVIFQPIAVGHHLGQIAAGPGDHAHMGIRCLVFKTPQRPKAGVVIAKKSLIDNIGFGENGVLAG